MRGSRPRLPRSSQCPAPLISSPSPAIGFSSPLESIVPHRNGGHHSIAATSPSNCTAISNLCPMLFLLSRRERGRGEGASSTRQPARVLVLVSHTHLFNDSQSSGALFASHFKNSISDLRNLMRCRITANLPNGISEFISAFCHTSCARSSSVSNYSCRFLSNSRNVESSDCSCRENPNRRSKSK